MFQRWSEWWSNLVRACVPGAIAEPRQCSAAILPLIRSSVALSYWQRMSPCTGAGLVQESCSFFLVSCQRVTKKLRTYESCSSKKPSWSNCRKKGEGCWLCRESWRGWARKTPRSRPCRYVLSARAVGKDLGVTRERYASDSGVTRKRLRSDSGVIRERLGSDSGATPEWYGSDSGVAREWLGSDSEATREWYGSDSGVARELFGSDAGIRAQCVWNRAEYCTLLDRSRNLPRFPRRLARTSRRSNSGDRTRSRLKTTTPDRPASLAQRRKRRFTARTCGRYGHCPLTPATRSDVSSNFHYTSPLP